LDCASNFRQVQVPALHLAKLPSMRTVFAVLGLTLMAIGQTEEIPFADLQLGTRGLPGTSVGQSFGSRISADSRYLAFSSRFSGLVPGDWLTDYDIYVRSLQTGRVIAVNQGPNGALVSAAGSGLYASDNAKLVLFTTDARLVASDTDSRYDIYLRDTTANLSRRLYATSSTLASASDRSLIDGAEQGASFIFSCRGQIYHGDINTKEPRLVSHQLDGGTAADYISSAAISPDGGRVLFASLDPEIGAALPFQRRRLYLWNRATNSNQEIPLPGRSPNLLEPVRIEANRVIVRTDVRLVSHDEEETSDLYAIDLSTFIATRLTEDKYGQSFPPPQGINDAAGDIVFVSGSSFPGAVIFNHRTGWFERVQPDRTYDAKLASRLDRPVLATVSQAGDGQQHAGFQTVGSGSWLASDIGSLPSLPNSATYDAVLSGDAKRLTFFTGASNIVTGNTYGTFQFDRTTGQTKHITTQPVRSISGNGRYGLINGSVSPQRLDFQTNTVVDLPKNISESSLSEDGRYLTFLSNEKLVAADKDTLPDVYVLLVGTNEYRLVSRTATGERLPVTLKSPILTANRQTVIFVGRNPGTRAFENLFRNNLSGSAGAVRAESLALMNGNYSVSKLFASLDGTNVLVSSSESGGDPGTLLLLKSLAEPVILSNRGVPVGLSANGQIASFQEDNTLFVRRLSDGKTFIRAAGRPQFSNRTSYGGVSDDGNWLAWQLGSQQAFALGRLKLPASP